MTGKIDPTFIEELTDRANIVHVIHPYVALKKSGNSHKGLCPFHKEKTPSFNVSEQQNFYYCFGCKAAGDTIGFLMSYLKIDFVQAINTLARDMGVEVVYTDKQTAAQEQDRQSLYKMMDQVAQFYREQLNCFPESVRYLHQRGINDEMIQRFEIGYAPRGRDHLLKALGRTDDIKDTMIKAGLLIDKKDSPLRDRFYKRIIFPIRDERGRIITFSGRAIESDTAQGPKYLHGPETSIFSKSRAWYGLYHARQAHRQCSRLLVVEGYTDVIALAQCGIDYAVASMGTAVSAQQVQQLLRVAPEVVFCFDGDVAGRQATHGLLDTIAGIMRDGWVCRFALLPEDEDPDSLLRKEHAEGFEKVLTQASVFSEFFFTVKMDGLNMDIAEDRAKLARIAYPILRKIPGQVLRENMLNALALHCQTVREKLDDIVPTTVNHTASRPQSPKNQYITVECRVMRNLLSAPQIVTSLLSQYDWLEQLCQSLMQSEQCEKKLLATVLLHLKEGNKVGLLLNNYPPDTHEYQILTEMMIPFPCTPENMEKECSSSLELLWNQHQETQVKSNLKQYVTYCQMLPQHH